MTETDSFEINQFILRAALNKEPVLNSYKEFCEIRGNQDMDYVDFEFKYYQLYHGKQGERSSLKISDLPIDALGKIVGKLSLVDRLILRKVSRDLRNLVDSSEGHCEKIYFGKDYTIIESENVRLRYLRVNLENCWITSTESNTEKKKMEVNQNYIQAMLLELAAIVKNPKVRIGTMEIGKPDDESMTQFLEFLKSLNFKLNVRSVEIKNSKLIIPLLQFLNPDKLKNIISINGGLDINEFVEMVKTNLTILKNPQLKISKIVFRYFSDASLARYLEILKSADLHHNFRLICIKNGRWINPVLQSLNPEIVEDVIVDQVPLTADQFNEICEMEEWKKKTRLVRCRIPVFGLERFRGFKAFGISEFKINDDNLVKIRDIILKCPHFESCCLDDENYERTQDEAYEQLDRIMSQSPLYDVQTRRMSIPNSRHYFQLSCQKYNRLFLRIIKKSEN